ncbi:class I SAM-dependent methyltransferase [Streptomyces sp. adm13(2018)]|uniref:class I SAM-dependent methyltransferase n=1 Tax=Streptomyces sp. adm13(2018) TaxID=2479007 RepID=UPI0011CE88AA|nr:class I SAM-dependent methyltransferase [Streptomyces sp. adm13(2018)]TXS19276.1 class I SAM-dependent methyltransferase [Streptomyces sp. adm13(2018)]
MSQHTAPHHGLAHGDGHRHQHTPGDPHGTGDQHRPCSHHSGAPLDWNEIAPLLEQQAETESPAYADAAAWLGTLAPAQGVRRVLDVGSGPGVVTGVLAEAFPAAEAVAVDGSPELLARARERAAERGLGARVSTLHTELPAGIAELGKADLIWAGNSLHHIGDQRAALVEFVGLLNPGGLMVLVEGGLPARHLPWHIGFGRPGLEARLDAANADRFAEMRAETPGHKDEPDDWRALLADAGLTPAGTRTFLTDVPAPVSPVVRGLALAHFGRVRDSFDDRIDAEDRAALDRLLDPADDLSLHHRTDLFYLAARTVHTARKG